MYGDGSGGTEKLVGQTSTEEECANLVMKTEPNANGATWEGGECYAEYEAIGVSSNDQRRTCLFGG